MTELHNPPNESEISDLPDKEFKSMVIKMLTDLGRKMENMAITSKN